MEATFQEVRHSVWVSRPRGSAPRKLPGAPLRRCWLCVLSLVTLFAHRRMAQGGSRTVRRAAWYDKSRPTFTDALALVRKELWAQETFCGSPRQDETVKVPRAFVERLTDAVCYAA